MYRYKNTIIMNFNIYIFIDDIDKNWLFLSIVNYNMYKNFTE